jgi:uncharacterized protein (TIGR00299 family) protein
MKGAFRATKIEVHVDAHERGEAHPHRDLPAILALIGKSGLPGPVRDRATRIFTRLGEAEGRVHGVPPERVPFHDVGAVDAIVDITGACLGLHLLGVDAVHCSALPIGGGLVRGPHGPMPVPGPGTAELLKGFPVVDTGIRRELVTPTGAAILTTLAASAGTMPPMTVRAVGYGAGTMDLETPNIVRVFLGEAVAGAQAAVPGGAIGAPDIRMSAQGLMAAAGDLETVVQVETTIDDMSPQLYEPLMDRLFEAGALDVYLVPVLMKKSRPGVVVTALCEPGAVSGLARACFEETTTIGVRWTGYRRHRLPREIITLDTSLGPLAFKLSRLGDRVVTATPEFDDVKRLARQHGLPVREALDRVRAEARRLLSP